MEKLKDILYDISDILLALFIIAIMTTVISWKFAGSLAGNSDMPIDTEIPASETPLEEIPAIESKPDEPIAESPESIDKEIEIPEPDPQPEPEPEPEAPIVYTTIKIPSGSTAVRIAGILKDAGIVESTTEFINRTEARGLSSKLQSGSFKIGSDDSMDKIINILTGQ